MNERDRSGAELRWVGTGHSGQPSGEGNHSATITGTFLVGQVRTSTRPEQGAVHLFAEIDQPGTNVILRMWDEAPNGKRQLISSAYSWPRTENWTRSAPLKATRSTRTRVRFPSSPE
jgi:hypothetical protein